MILKNKILNQKKIWTFFILICLAVNMPAFAEESGNNGGGGDNGYNIIRREIRDGKPYYAYRVSNSGGDQREINIEEKNNNNDEIPDYNFDPEISDEENAARQAAVEAEKRRREAENNAVVTLKTIMEIQEKQKQLQSEIKELEKKFPLFTKIDPVTDSSYQTYQKKLKEVKQNEKQLTDLKSQKPEMLKNLETANQQLADILSGLMSTGDPVTLYSGEYQCDYKEVIGKRKYIRGIQESFGINWSCPLDSRIVRCRFESWRNLLEKYEEILSLCRQALFWGEWYDTTYPEYSGMKPYNELVKEIIDIHERWLQKGWDIAKRNESAEKLNIYVTYGRFAEYSSYYELPEVIKFVDEYGDVYSCVFNGQCWVPAADKYSSYFSIYGRRESDGNTNYYGDDSGGFAVYYFDGSSTYYSKYGILQKKIDAHGNVTEYFSDNGVINGISLPTGEYLSVKRNSFNCIESITGSFSGTSRFEYSDGRVLTGYTNPDGIKITYSYDTYWRLSEIGKADGTSVKIEYGPDGYWNKGWQSVSKITNESGDSETFEYSAEGNERKVLHTTYEGLKEVFLIDQAGRTVYKNDGKGNVTKVKYDDLSNISEMEVNGKVRKFYLDNAGNIFRTVFSDGTDYSVEYRNKQIVKEKDRDGAIIEYELNEQNACVSQLYCGVLQTSMDYYKNGNLKSVEDKNQKIEFLYDSNNQIIEKRTTIDGNTFVEKWEYDQRNRPVLYENSYGEKTKVSYSQNSKVEILNDRKKIEHFYNVRGWEVKTVETDLWSGKKHSKELVYDGSKRLKRILIDGKLWRSYVYKKGRLLESFTQWNVLGTGYTNEYVCDSENRVVEVIKYQVDKDGIPVGSKKSIEKISYEKRGAETVVNTKYGQELNWQFTYDSEGRLVYLRNPNGDSAEYSFTATGKALKSKELNGIETRYVYENDGSYQVLYKEGGNKTATAFFDERNRMQSINNFNGENYSFDYDETGRVIMESGPDYTISYVYDAGKRYSGAEVYDENGRLFYKSAVVYSEEVVSDTERKQIVNYYEGSRCVRTEVLDAWGRPIEVTDLKGTVWNEYDGLGNLVYQKDLTGRVKEFAYNPYGDVLWIKDNRGFLRSYDYDFSGNLIAVFQNNKKVFEAEYDDAGRLLYEKGDGRELSYGYKSDGSFAYTRTFNSGKTEYEIAGFDRTEVVDSMGGKYSYIIGTNGKVKSMINPEGKELSYDYDSYDRVISKKYPSGKTERIIYGSDSSVAEKWMKVSDEKGFYKTIKYDLGGKIIHAENNNSQFDYEYDENGLLVQMTDLILNESAGYEYDQYKRCIRKYGSLFDFYYSYDDLGRICSVNEKKSDAWVNCKYNDEGKEIYRNYSNGVSVEREYTDTGKLCAIVAKNWAGQIIFGEYILYNADEKIQGVFFNSGCFYWCEYDSMGRLCFLYSDYNDKQLESKRKEAFDCGLFISDEALKGIQLKVPNGIVDSVTQFFIDKGMSSYSFPLTENVWFEEYEYNSVGNMKTEYNPFGCIMYEYDRLNRITKKHGANTDSEGIKILWDDDGNMQKISASRYSVELEYAFENRPKQIVHRNFDTGEVITQNFTYDPFNRRYGETVIDKNGIKSRCFMYDGLSLNLLMDTPVHQNGLSSLAYEVLPEDLQQMGKLTDFKLADIGNQSSENFSNVSLNESIPQVFLELNGLPDLIIYKDGNSVSGTGYCLQIGDNKNSVQVITDNLSEDFNSQSYDIWGNGSDTGTGENRRFAGSRFVLNGGVTCYDLGFRDYIPLLKCFTSEDPARDGTNWYAYCSCDPVNFIDIAGFEMLSLNSAERILYENFMSQFMNFDQMNYLNTGSDMNIPKGFDCADNSALTNYLALQSIGKTPESQMLKDFGNTFKDNKDAAKNKTSSDDYLKGNTLDVRKLVDGFGSGYINHSGANSKDPKLQYEQDRKKETLKALSNPDTITPGTVLAWRVNKENHSSKDSTDWTGHTATILGREYNPDGSIRGFICLEGHDRNKPAELTYINLIPNTSFEEANNLASYFGDFEGAFAVEPGTKDYNQGCGN